MDMDSLGRGSIELEMEELPPPFPNAAKSCHKLVAELVNKIAK